MTRSDVVIPVIGTLGMGANLYNSFIEDCFEFAASGSFGKRYDR
jgi:hypothetical protein